MLLKVCMTKKKIEKEPFPKGKIIGGRAMIDYLMTQYGSPTAHPLSKESFFIVAPGLLAGTTAPQSGRLSVGGKSPLTGGIKEANSGGTAAHKLARVGIRGIMVQGRASEWQILKIGAKEVSFEKAEEIVGLKNYAACEKLQQRYGDHIGIIITGPAGEMKLANSTVAVTDLEGRPCRHCARGGVGALMGAKGLKAIVIEDSEGSVREAQDKNAFKEAVKEAVKVIQSIPWVGSFHEFGTPLLVDVDNAQGSLPTNNHRLGAFEQFQDINGERMVELNRIRGGSMGHACMPWCVVRCSPVFHDPSGKFLTAALEYETLASLGSNLGIADMDSIARMDRQCDDLGIDTIEMGCTIGVLNDVGLFRFGDAVGAERLIDEIGKGTPMGRILGSGVVNAAKVFGIDRIPAVKGQGIPAHTARSRKGWGVTYATSPQGADHTAGVVHDGTSPIGQVEKSRNAQIAYAGIDAAGLCMFTFLADKPEVIVPMINALYGVNWTVSDYHEMAKEMLRLERAFNIKAGISPKADRLPDWMRTEPLPPTNAVFDVPQEEIEEIFNF